MQRKKRRKEKGKERASREGFEKKKCKGRKERRKKKGNRKGGAPRLLQADLERGAQSAHTGARTHARKGIKKEERKGGKERKGRGEGLLQADLEEERSGPFDPPSPLLR